MANFFIDRPIFAWVLAILLCLTGTLAILSLPVEQYPDLAPPNVRITANYPGASAQTLENTVTQVIEQNMTGLDNLMYMSSQSSGTGQATVTLSFTAGTDPDEAVQQVQNQLQSAMRKLPQAVADYSAFFLGRAKSIEAALEDCRDWLVGGRFTIVDICVGYAVHLSSGFGLVEQLGPKTQEWYERLNAREGFGAAQAREKE